MPTTTTITITITHADTVTADDLVAECTAHLDSLRHQYTIALNSNPTPNEVSDDVTV